MPRNRSEQKRTGAPAPKRSAAPSTPATPPEPAAGRRDRGADGDPREALARSERQATAQEPQNFREQATADKVVEVGPDVQDQPIQGIDPVEPGRRQR